MQEFAQQVETFLQRAERQYQPPFEVTHDVTYCGHRFAMLAGYTKRDDRYFMRIVGALKQEGLCGEQCFFDSCETLDEQAWEQYTALFGALQDALVPKDDPAHDFTLISFVLCTRGVDSRLRRKIKRFRDYRTYKTGKQEYGWSALRLCVVDVADDAYYCNDMGKAVVECLTRSEFPAEKRRGLFSR